MVLIKYIHLSLVLCGFGFITSAFAGNDNFKTIESNEFIARTSNDCGLVEKVKGNSKYKSVRIESVKRDIWEGICVDGLALGPGKIINRNANGETTGLSEMWMLYGRPIGQIKTTYISRYNSPDLHTEGFYWNGEGYSRRGNTKLSEETQADRDNLFINYQPREATKWISFGLNANCYDSKSQTTGPCIAEMHHTNTDNFEDGVTRYFCKSNECEGKWRELTDKLVSEYELFERTHTAEVEAAKKIVEPILLKARADKQKAEAEAELIAMENKRKAQIEQRQKEFSQANLAKIPVASPALEELIRRTLNGGGK